MPMAEEAIEPKNAALCVCGWLDRIIALPWFVVVAFIGRGAVTDFQGASTYLLDHVPRVFEQHRQPDAAPAGGRAQDNGHAQILGCHIATAERRLPVRVGGGAGGGAVGAVVVVGFARDG